MSALHRSHKYPVRMYDINIGNIFTMLINREWTIEEPRPEKVGGLYMLLEGLLALINVFPRHPLDRNHYVLFWWLSSFCILIFKTSWVENVIWIVEMSLNTFSSFYLKGLTNLAAKIYVCLRTGQGGWSEESRECTWSPFIAFFNWIESKEASFLPHLEDCVWIRTMSSLSCSQVLRETESNTQTEAEEETSDRSQALAFPDTFKSFQVT